MKTDYLTHLNTAQRQAVEYIDGPSLVIAGAGSGKTRVLTYKIIHLLANGYRPEEIMVLTFTNKAASEMRERIEKMISRRQATRLWMGTFHSIFARILRLEAQLLGYQSNFIIYDTIDSRNVIKQIIRELQLDPKTYQTNFIHSRISRAKNNLITPEYYLQHKDLTDHDRQLRIPMFSQIFMLYQNRLKQAGAMDFDDLLLNTNVLFRDFPQVLERYQQIFRFILVDEYQDTNYAQYLIIKKLAQKHRHISVVGDDAQSIYAFRGARIENIFSFQKDFPDFKLFKLEQNYRSTKKIVNAANSIIAKNERQIPKTIYSTAEEGNDIVIVSHPTDYEEGRWVAQEIKGIHDLGVPYSDIAILYRMNFQSRIFEDFLRRENIPYRIYGGISFYQRKEIKDVLAYMRLSINPLDDEALRRIINYPTRGIGAQTQTKIFSFAREQNMPIWNVIERIETLPLGMGSRAVSAIKKFRSLIQTLREKAYKLDIYDFTHFVLKNAGILAELESDNSQEAKNRMENVMELLSAIKEYAANTPVDQDFGIEEFLQQIALLTSEDTDTSDADRVNVMTVHSAKGLEFNTVFLVGTEQRIFPSDMAKASPHELEEERRLFYVALTRAKKQVYISYAERRKFWGRIDQQEPSIFIDEIDQQYVRYSLHNDYSDKKWDIPGTSYQRFKREEPQQTVRQTVQKTVSTHDISKMKKIKSSQTTQESEIDYEPTTGIRVGMKVKHAKFGIGTVRRMTGAYPNTKAEIDFGSLGVKKILLKFAKLQVME